MEKTIRNVEDAAARQRKERDRRKHQKREEYGGCCCCSCSFFFLFFPVKTEGRSFMRRGRRAMRPHVSGSSGRIEKK